MNQHLRASCIRIRKNMWINGSGIQILGAKYLLKLLALISQNSTVHS